MSIGSLWWVLYVVGLVFYGYRNRGDSGIILDSLFWWVLIGLLGYAVFGGPIK